MNKQFLTIILYFIVFLNSFHKVLNNMFSSFNLYSRVQHYFFRVSCVLRRPGQIMTFISGIHVRPYSVISPPVFILYTSYDFKTSKMDFQRLHAHLWSEKWKHKYSVIILTVFFFWENNAKFISVYFTNMTEKVRHLFFLQKTKFFQSNIFLNFKFLC